MTDDADLQPLVAAECLALADLLDSVSEDRWDTPSLCEGWRAREVIALDDALTALAKINPRQARVIELRFFAGLSVEETAEVSKVSPDTVMRDWRLARAWLLAELGDRQNDPR